MGVKANLKIQLLAGDVLVAEAEDDHLWRKVLAAIQGSSGQDAIETEEVQGGYPDDEEKSGRQHGGKGVSGLAKELEVKLTELQGACDPRMSEPYIHLDAKCWEAFKKNTPTRGPKSIAAIKLAGTMLCLWFKQAGISGLPTQAQAIAVLGDLGVSDKNPSRAISNCSWLQSRSGGIQINPAELSVAHAVAKAFITKSSLEVSE